MHRLDPIEMLHSRHTFVYMTLYGHDIRGCSSTWLTPITAHPKNASNAPAHDQLSRNKVFMVSRTHSVPGQFICPELLGTACLLPKKL